MLSSFTNPAKNQNICTDHLKESYLETEATDGFCHLVILDITAEPTTANIRKSLKSAQSQLCLKFVAQVT